MVDGVPFNQIFFGGYFNWGFDFNLEDIERIVTEIERELRTADSVEVDSKKIGQMVATKLKTMDKVAYIRFSSVFRRFVDVEDFEKEVKKLIK